jgi:hypothetical protein
MIMTTEEERRERTAARSARDYFAEFARRTGSRKPVSTKQAGAAPTDAQVKYYLDLCRKRGIAAGDPHSMNRLQVSDAIDALKSGKVPAGMVAATVTPPKRRSGRATAGAYRIQSPPADDGGGKMF